MSDAPYEDRSLTHTIADALRPFCGEGERVIWRAPFRWMDDRGVMSNCYEMFDLAEVCELAGLVVVEDFKHAAIVRPACLSKIPGGATP
jgi:hypothetical protein